MAGIKISPNRLAISISVNGLNAYWMTDTLQLGLKNKSLMYAACKIHLQKNDRRRLKIRGWKQLCHANINKIKVGRTVIISNKIELKVKNNEKTLIRAKTYFTLIKINIYRKAVSAMNFYAPNNIALIHKAKTTRYTRKK